MFLSIFLLFGRRVCLSVLLFPFPFSMPFMVEENGKALIVPEALIVDIITVNAPFMITRRKYPLSKEMNANPNENKNVTFILVGARWW